MAQALEYLSDTMKSEKYSDLKLICQGQEFKVHKVIVCSQSHTFATMLESGFREAQTSTVDIEEFDRETVRRIVDFFYEKDYKDTSEVVDGGDGSEGGEMALVVANQETTPATTSSPTDALLRIHLKVNAIAEYYDVPQLKELANIKIKSILEQNWYCDRFLDLCEESVQKTRDKGLFKLLATFMAEHIEEIIKHDRFDAKVPVHLDEENNALENLSSLHLRESSGLAYQNPAPKFLEECSWEVMVQMAAQIEELKAALVAKDKSSQAIQYEYDQYKRSSERVFDTEKYFKEAAEEAIKRLDSVYKCRNCGKDFGCYFEKGGDHRVPKYRLRCSKCDCRH